MLILDPDSRQRHSSLNLCRLVEGREARPAQSSLCRRERERDDNFRDSAQDGVDVRYREFVGIGDGAQSEIVRVERIYDCQFSEAGAADCDRAEIDYLRLEYERWTR